MPSFCDQDSVTADHLLAHYGAALAQCEFHDAGVGSRLLRPPFRCGRGLDATEFHDLSFRFGDNLVFDDDDVTGSERQFLSSQCAQDFLAQVIAGPNLVCERDRNERDRSSLGHCSTAVMRRSSPVAMAGMTTPKPSLRANT